MKTIDYSLFMGKTNASEAEIIAKGIASRSAVAAENGFSQIENAVSTIELLKDWLMSQPSDAKTIDMTPERLLRTLTHCSGSIRLGLIALRAKADAEIGDMADASTIN